MLSPSASPTPAPMLSRLRHSTSRHSPILHSHVTPVPFSSQQELSRENLQVPLIRPNEVISNPRYVFLAEPERTHLNQAIAQLWRMAQNHPDQNVREDSMTRIKMMSRSLLERRKKWKAILEQRKGVGRRNQATQDNLRAQGQQFGRTNDNLQAQTAMSAPQAPPAHRQQYPHSVRMLSTQSIPIQDSASLPTMIREQIHQQLPQMWQCLKILKALKGGEQNEIASTQIQQAGQWLAGFRSTLTLNGQIYVRHLVPQMWRAFDEGRDPLKVIES